MAKNVSQEHFDASIAGLDNKFVTKEHFNARLDGLRSEIRQDIRELVQEMRQGFRRTEERFGVLEAKTDAIMQILVTRNELRNLTRELRSLGVRVEDHKVFQ